MENQFTTHTATETPEQALLVERNRIELIVQDPEPYSDHYLKLYTKELTDWNKLVESGSSKVPPVASRCMLKVAVLHIKALAADAYTVGAITEEALRTQWAEACAFHEKAQQYLQQGQFHAVEAIALQLELACQELVRKTTH